MRIIPEDIKVIYRVKVTHKYGNNTGKTHVTYLGPYTTIGAARSRATKERNRYLYNHGPKVEAEVQGSEVKFGPVFEAGAFGG